MWLRLGKCRSRTLLGAGLRGSPPVEGDRHLHRSAMVNFDLVKKIPISRSLPLRCRTLRKDKITCTASTAFTWAERSNELQLQQYCKPYSIKIGTRKWREPAAINCSQMLVLPGTGPSGSCLPRFYDLFRKWASFSGQRTQAVTFAKRNSSSLGGGVPGSATTVAL